MPLRDMNREQMWLLPPMLDDLLALAHPARFVAEFVDALDRKAWAELGVEIEGDPLGAPAYHPRALLSVWLYGFMTGVRSSRKLEVACRDQIPFLWLTGWQQPDHNTLWRFYRCHRQGMRDLFKRTVRTAVAMELVDLTVQAVDGTRLAANAAADQSYTGEKLEQLLERVDEAIEELESQNEGGEDGATVRLPDQLTNRKALRQRVKQAIEELSGRDRPNRYKRPNRINLTDMDARLVKTGYGVVPGYNAQAMVSPVELEGKEAGMLITAADVVDKSYDNGMLVPMMEKAEEATGTKVPMTLADSGYFAGSELEECAQRGQKVVVPEVHQKTVDHPYHKDRFIYDETTDTYTCPQGQSLRFAQHQFANRAWNRVYRSPRAVCLKCPAKKMCTSDGRRGRRIVIGPHDLALRRHREWMSTDAAKREYQRRKYLVEPVFGIIKEQMGVRRFLLRGLPNVTAEWAALATAFNLRTLWRAWRSGQFTFLPTGPGCLSPELR